MDYRELIQAHEGFDLQVYLDSEGNETVGWGHCFWRDPKPSPGDFYSLEECAYFFDEDMQSVERHYVAFEKKFDLIPIRPVRRAVLKNMLFNLGIDKLLGFRKMWKAIQEKNWKVAAMEMLDSRWARQVKGRAKELAKMMETGKWQR